MEQTQLLREIRDLLRGVRVLSPGPTVPAGSVLRAVGEALDVQSDAAPRELSIGPVAPVIDVMGVGLSWDILAFGWNAAGMSAWLPGADPGRLRIVYAMAGVRSPGAQAIDHLMRWEMQPPLVAGGTPPVYRVLNCPAAAIANYAWAGDPGDNGGISPFGNPWIVPPGMTVYVVSAPLFGPGESFACYALVLSLPARALPPV